jgi:trehalose 6-phosphate phosphatase
MEHLFSAWPAVLDDLRDARGVLLLTDFDGTLTPIVQRPEMARLSDDMKYLLQRVSQRNGVTLGIVSGRAMSDLRSRVGMAGIVYAANHGMEIEGPGVYYVNPLAEEMRPILRAISFVLSKSLHRVKGALVENKGLTLSVHYRMVDAERAHEVEDVVKRVVGSAQAAGKAKVTSGKKVHEIRPGVDWNKGKAVKLLMKRYGKGGRRSGLLPVYLGDDATDEDAFKVIESYGKGVSVFVGEGSGQTSARYCLRSTAEVGQFLGMLSDSMTLGQLSDGRLPILRGCDAGMAGPLLGTDADRSTP